MKGSTGLKKLATAVIAVMMLVPQVSMAYTVGVSPVITNHYASPNPYDPSSSTNNGKVTVYYTLNTDAVVTVEILDGSTVIGNLGQASKSSGNNFANWDGKENGVYVTEKTYNYRVTATNTWGTTIAQGSILVDFAVNPGTAPVITNDYASPNPFDPSDENTTIYYTLNTNATVTVSILEGATVVRTLNTTSQSAGINSMSWNGEINGSDADEGTYTYSIYASNTNGNATKTGSVTVDYVGQSGTAPNVTNTYASPSSFDPDDEDTTIYYTLNTTAYVTITVLDGSSTIETLQSAVSKSAGTYSVNWDGKDSSNNAYDEGTYTYKIYATNTYGNDTETGSVTIDYDSSSCTTPSITSHYVTPTSFDPDDDDARITFTTNTSSDVTVTIRDNSGVIRTLVDDDSMSSGTHNVYWNGNDDDGDQVDDGTYTYRIYTTNSCGTYTEQSTVRVDTGNDNNDDDFDDDYGDLISNISVEDATFDPDDGERAKLLFDVEEDDVAITVKVINEDENTVRTLLSNRDYDESNENSIYWNGKDDDSDIVDDDLYIFKITATKSGNTEVAYEWLEVDTDGDIIGLPDDDNDDEFDDDYGNLIDNISVDDATFNPEDSERAKLLFDVLKDNVNVTVTIIDEDSDTVRKLVTSKSYDESDENSVYWNGKDSDSDIVDDDLYLFKITATKSGDTEVAYEWLEVDTDGDIIGLPDDNDSGSCAGYTDVSEDNPYCKAVELMKIKGIFTGYSDGTFRLYSAINRAETTKVTLLAIGYSIMSDNGTNLGFWDVIKGSWYMPYLRTAQNKGIVSGYPDSSFRPTSTPNKVELLKIFLEGTGVSIPYCSTAPYNDTPVTSDTRWYIDYVCYAVNHGLISGDSNGNFNPDSSMTRGDVAMLFYNFYVKGLGNYVTNY
jgi:flagellar hook assembly protein FlgD